MEQKLFTRIPGKLIVIVWTIMLAASATLLYGQDGNHKAATAAPTTPFSIGKVFTFLFLTIGPLKIIAPFVEMTRGRDNAFKRKLAFRGLLLAAVAIVVAATTGVKTLGGWGVSVGALKLAAGIVLFLIALAPVLEQYKPKKSTTIAVTDDAPPPSVSSLALSPLAFPTIVTPYGIAVMVLLVTLRPDHLWEIVAVTAFVFALNLVAMLLADLILKSSVVSTLLSVMGAVVGVLQIALGVQVVVDALQDMGVL